MYVFCKVLNVHNYQFCSICIAEELLSQERFDEDCAEKSCRWIMLVEIIKFNFLSFN